ncbi:MAG: hypothetical protein AAGD14_04250 [Planctomycetota bacterium]
MRVGVALLLVTTTAAAQPFEEWLPPRTVLCFSVRDAAKLRLRVQRSPLPTMFAHPGAEGSWEMLRAFLIGRGADPDATAALLEHPTGQVVMALWETGGAAFELQGALLADVRGSEERFRRAWMRLLRDEERRHRVERRERRVAGVTVHERSFRVGRESVRSAWFLQRGVFGFAPDATQLAGLLTRRRAGGESFAQDAGYRRFRARVPGTPDILLYVSSSLWGPRAAPELQPMLRAGGFANLTSFGMQLSFVEEGVYSRVHLDLDGPRRGLLRMFRPAEESLAPPRWLPLRTAAAATLRLDHRRMLGELMRAADTIHPGLQQLLQQDVRRIAKEKGVDLGRDLVAALGARTTLALLPLDARLRRDAKQRGMPPDLYGLALVQEVENEAAMTRVLRAGLSLLGVVTRREIEGVPVFVVPGREGGAAAIFDGHLVLARHVDLVADLIARWRRGGDGVRRGAVFARALAHAPERRSVFSFYAPPPMPAPLRPRDERTARLLRAAGHAPGHWWRAHHDLTVFSVADAGSGLVLTWFTGLRHATSLPTEK